MEQQPSTTIYITHHPGSCIMFNMRRASREKKGSNGQVFAEDWRTEEDCRIIVRIKMDEFPILLGHHGSMEIFCGQVLCHAHQNLLCPSTVHLKLLNHTKRFALGPIPRNYVFRFYSDLEARVFVYTLNSFIQDHCQRESARIANSAAGAEPDNKSHPKDKEEGDHHDVEPQGEGEPAVTNEEQDHDVEPQGEVRPAVTNEEHQEDEDSYIFEDDMFPNTQDPFEGYISD